MAVSAVTHANMVKGNYNNRFLGLSVTVLSALNIFSIESSETS